MQEHSANYYFLKRFLHPQPYFGYRQSIVNLLINRNKDHNNGKYLFIKEKTGLWFFPKGHIVGTDIQSSFFESISQTLEKELGFHGMKIFELKPSFTQLAYIFDFERQKYNPIRQEAEKEKGNPAFGKIYHLAIMEYKGSEEFEVSEKSKIMEYKWVTKEEGVELLKALDDSLIPENYFTEASVRFYRRFFEKIVSTAQELEIMRGNKDPFQARLI